MPEINDNPATVPAQPEVTGPMRKKTPLILVLVGIVLLIGISNPAGLLSGSKKDAPKSSLPGRPGAASSRQVNSFEAQQNNQARQDAEDRARQQQLAEQMAALQAQGAVPGRSRPMRRQ